MKKIIVLKTGDTFPGIQIQWGDFEDWIIRGMDVDEHLVKVVDVVRGDDLPSYASCKGVVMAGSHAMVTEELPWSVDIEKWLPGCIQEQIPVLGICYGHQLLAKAMGGKVDFHPRGIEIGTVHIEMVDNDSFDPLFNGIQGSFPAHVCHSQTVTQLPENAICVARNEHESTHAFKIGSLAWGVQFHPEYDDQIMQSYIQNLATAIEASGQDMTSISGQTQPTPIALKILHRFGKLVS